jgi:L-ribulose-5-phosphate 3-epimerase UlaE
MTFEAALKKVPACAIGNVDLVGGHKTVADLRYCVRHELDMWEEGQETDIKSKRDVEACRQFLRNVNA